MDIHIAVQEIKNLLEKSIIEGGQQAKINLIRSQKPINLIHNTVKYELVKNGVNPDHIKPPLDQSKGELKLAGFMKQKNQDICVIPEDVSPQTEELDFGPLYGKRDKYGKTFTEKILSINVRSQLSSLAKNFDTLYERTFAESLNLHLRCPKMVLGEVYMIPAYEYDTEKAKKKEIGFVKSTSSVAKYLKSFQAINNRRKTSKDEFKYEKVCLLVVDFTKEKPKIYDNDEELIKDGFLSENSNASIEDLSFDKLIPSLLKEYKNRF